MPGHRNGSDYKYGLGSIQNYHGFGSGSVSGSAWIQINLSSRIRIRIQEGKNDPQKYKKVQNFHVSKCWMFS
jgi:hypothetical protein